MNQHSDFAPLFLAIDGGGTNCRARLCNQSGQQLGAGQAGSANTTLGLDKTFAEIMNATEIAIAQAGFTKACLNRIHAGLGLAGLSLQRDHKAVNAYEVPFASFRAETDAHIACLGAHQGKDGAILIIGTGVCGLKLENGRSKSVGGWGFALSDQGGGAHLGRAALRLALAEHDGVSARSRLGSALMAHFGDNPEAMVIWSETATPKSYGRFAPDVFKLAAQGDAAAATLIRAAASDVERTLLALMGDGPGRVVLIGGLAEPLLPWLSDRVTAQLTRAQGDPLDGALMLARLAYEETASHV